LRNKYNAIRSVYDSMIWDSNLELGVYKWFKKVLVYRHSEVTLRVKPGVIIKPACNVFKERKWKCDFQLCSTDNHINIEIKGFATTAFTLTLEMLEACNPSEFNRTYILTDCEDVMKRYKKIGDRLLWLPDVTDSIANPANWKNNEKTM
jgi:hypothetical protein